MFSLIRSGNRNWTSCLFNRSVRMPGWKGATRIPRYLRWVCDLIFYLSDIQQWFSCSNILHVVVDVVDLVFNKYMDKKKACFQPFPLGMTDLTCSVFSTVTVTFSADQWQLSDPFLQLVRDFSYTPVNVNISRDGRLPAPRRPPGFLDLEGEFSGLLCSPGMWVCDQIILLFLVTVVFAQIFGANRMGSIDLGSIRG